MGSIKGTISANCKCCTEIETGVFTVDGRLDQESAFISMCCDEWIGRPKIPFWGGSVEEKLNEWLGMRISMLTDCAANDGAHIECPGCTSFVEKEWHPRLKISAVNLNCYPSPCQCRCVYCGWNASWVDTPEVRAGWNRLFDMLELAKERGVISSDALWQTASGELTIHPMRERIFELTRGCRTRLLTNGFLYDEGFAQNLRENDRSVVNVSIDAGTRETYQKVKGFDKLDTVVNNLEKYHQVSVKGQIEIKYIILPGINDKMEDYLGVIDILNRLDVKMLIISSDATQKYRHLTRAGTIAAAAKLCALCKENNILPRVLPLTFTPEEIAEINRKSTTV